MIKSIFSTNIKTNQVSFALLILRISFGTMMLTHGFPKLMRIIDGNWKFGDPLGIGKEASLVLVVLAEFGGSIMLILGLWTRVGAFLLSFAMGVAAFIAHADDPFGTKEKALMYLTVFVFFLITGGGKFSMDRKFE